MRFNMNNRIPPDDWEEPSMEQLSANMKNMKLPPGFIPAPGEAPPSYVPNSPPGAYAPQPNINMAKANPTDFQTPEEVMAFMAQGNNQMLNPSFAPGPAIKPAFTAAPVKPPVSNGPAISNPLTKYYRVPGLHVNLPSRGVFNYGEINFETNGELSILPMTASDELLLKNPDALMSGNAIESIIRSCVPGISNPRNLPVSDVDVLLMGIRATSFGNNLEYVTECPKCKTKNEYNVNIRELLETITFYEDQYVVQLDDGLFAYLRPFVLEDQTRLNIATFQEAKKMQVLNNDAVPDEVKIAKFNESVKRLNDLGMELTANNVIKIVTPDAEVTEKVFIKDFLNNCSRTYTKKIDDCVKLMGDIGMNKKKTVKCCNEECGHDWEADISFDPANFFA